MVDWNAKADHNLILELDSDYMAPDSDSGKIVTIENSMCFYKWHRLSPAGLDSIAAHVEVTKLVGGDTENISDDDHANL